MWREFHFKKGAKTQIWKIKIDEGGVSYTTEHGQLHGKLQSFSDSPGEKGKFGTLAYVSAKDNTLFHVSREIRKKEESGYCEIDTETGKPLKKQITSIDWSEYLPKNFCGYKPQTDISDKKFEEIFKKGLARFTRKYDGHCHYAVHHPWGWEIYSRRMDLATERFPHHIKELEALTYFGPGTIISGEMVCFGSNDVENFKNISRICRSLPEESRKLISTKELPEPKFVIYDVIFHNYRSLQSQTYDQRSQLWMSLDVPHSGSSLISRVEYFNLTPKSWMQFAKNHKWEGFVLTDGSAVPNSKFFSFSGKAERPMGHFKLKTLHTEDVVIYAGITGSGKFQGKIGALFVKQKWPEDHPKFMEYFSCGKVGSGLTDETRLEIEQELHKINVPIFDDEKDADHIDLQSGPGLTVEIEYNERQPGTQKFKFPVFLRMRLDKAPHDCYAQHLSEEE